MKTALLQSIDPVLASVATGLEPPEVETFVAQSERLGLLTRRRASASTNHGFHPLVRDFLAARLERELGRVEVGALHRRIADAARKRDWRAATYHFAQAGDVDRIHETLETAIEAIVGSGEVGLAAKYLEEHQPARDAAAFHVIRSRMAGRAMDVDMAMTHAKRAVELEPDSSIALGNLLSMNWLAGDHRNSLALAARVEAVATSAIQRLVAAASIATLRASDTGDLNEALRLLGDAASESRRLGLTHFEAIALLNSAMALRAQGRAAEVGAKASE